MEHPPVPNDPGRSTAPYQPPLPSALPLASEPGNELRRLSTMLRRRAALIVAGVVLVLGAVTALTLVWPRSYRSSALIVIEQRTGGGDAALGLLGQLGRASQIETEIELIKSRHVIERVVDRLDLHADVAATRDRVSAARRQREADLIEVRCDGDSPKGARDLCQAVLDNYMELRLELRRAEATATARFLREQVDLLGNRLAAAEDSLQAYGSRHGVVALGERAAEEVRGFTQVTAQRDQMQAERTALADLIDRIQSGEGAGGTRRYRDLASFPTFLQNPAVTQLLVTLVNLENERNALRLRRAETSTEVNALDRRISEIEQQLLGIGQSYRRALDARIASLDGALRTSGRRLAAIPEQQMQSARLERQTSLLNDLYTLLATRLREAEVAEAVNLPNVRVVDQASLPVDPSHPRPRLNLAMGGVLGLAFGLLLAVYREGTDDSIRDRRDVESRYGLPVLALLPRLRGPASILPVPQLRRPGDSATRKNDRQRHRSPRGRKLEHRHLAFEAFRALATDLRFSTRHVNGGTPAIVVTSAVRGEGKSFVACNLALARAAQGARTLLIDADIRGGGARRLFGLPPSGPGLSDVLVWNPSVKAAEVVWKGAVSGADLWVIPPGTPRLYAASIFERPKFASLLEHAKQQFDLIVIDAPPINVITDAVPIAASADAVLLVVRGSFTTRDSLDQTLGRLGRTRSYIVGAVLNDVAPSAVDAAGYRYTRMVELRA